MRSQPVSTTPRHVIDAARAGDSEALAQLLRHWNGPLFRLVMNMLADPLAADLTVQNVFTSIRKEVRYLQESEHFDRWIWALASEHCLRRAHSIPPGRFLQPSQGWLADALATLEPGARLAFLLHDLEGLSTEDVAWIFEESIEETSERIRIARVRMQPTPVSFRRRARRRLPHPHRASAAE